MLTVHAYGATSATEPLAPMTTGRRSLGPHDVLIEISYCGICHTDISHARSRYRFVIDNSAVVVQGSGLPLLS